MNLFSSTIKKNVLLVFKGIAMGAANKVPGVSGGVVAFVAGFYEELIYSLQKINLKAFSILVNRGWKPFVQYINGRFLGLLFLGVGISYFSVSLLLDFLIKNFETEVFGLFFGMILSSLYFIYQDVKKWNYKTVGFFLMGLGCWIADNVHQTHDRKRLPSFCFLLWFHRRFRNDIARALRFLFTSFVG